MTDNLVYINSAQVTEPSSSDERANEGTNLNRELLRMQIPVVTAAAAALDYRH